MPRIAEIQTKLSASDGQLGLALFMAAVGALIAMPLAGAAAHRYGSRTATAVTVACYGLSLPLLALAPDLIWLGLALLVVGAASGALDVSMNAQGVAVEKRYWRPIMSSLHGMFSLGAMAGAGTTGLIAALGVPLLPHFAGVAGLILMVSAVACRPMLPAAAEAGAEGPGFARPSLGILLPGIVALAALLSRGRHGRLERGLPEQQPRRRHQHGGSGFRGILHDHGGRPLHRRPSGRPARRRSCRARGRRARRARSRPQSADRQFRRCGDRLWPGRRRPVLRRSR